MLRWLVEQKHSATIEEVTDEILKELVEDHEYVVVYFSKSHIELIIETPKKATLSSTNYHKNDNNNIFQVENVRMEKTATISLTSLKTLMTNLTRLVLYL